MTKPLQLPVVPEQTDDPQAEPFFIGRGRAMVSLGPLNGRSYCPYACQFCYVNGPFPRYASRSPEYIVEWLASQIGRYDVIYVSGDTDSFAQPRAGEGLELLERLLPLGVDVLFTTRYVFNSSERARLERLARDYTRSGLLLVACLSISQLNHPPLEPPPIPSPTVRFEQLRWLKSTQMRTVLTIRPLIPVVPASEYVEIVTHGGEFCDVVLGGNLYVEPNGHIRGMIEKAVGRSMSNTLEVVRPLDFASTTDPWVEIHHPAAADALERECKERGIPFFMRSSPALGYLRREVGIAH